MKTDENIGQSPSGLKGEERKAITFFKKRLAERLPEENAQLLLFGSKARGDAHRESDIDLMVLLDRDTRAVVKKVYDSVIETQLATDVCFSLKPVSRKRFAAWQRKRTPFIYNVLRDGVTV